MTIRVLPDPAALARALADLVTTKASAAIASRGRFTLSLAGGSTPKAAYGLLAGEEFASRIDWSRVLLFWGDERCVPPDDALSNYRMVREVLLERVPIPPANVHRIRGEVDPRDAAADYEALLRGLLGTDPTVDAPAQGLDLVLLGLGEDGHTASLFPNQKAARASRRWVVAEYVPAVTMWRVTLAPAVLNSAGHVVFAVAGSGKAGVLRQVVEGSHQPDRLPAQVIRPSPGNLTWLVDRAAASQLTAASASERGRNGG
jgi:6-phosphogluconolactonase